MRACDFKLKQNIYFGDFLLANIIIKKILNNFSNLPFGTDCRFRNSYINSTQAFEALHFNDSFIAIIDQSVYFIQIYYWLLPPIITDHDSIKQLLLFSTSYMISMLKPFGFASVVPFQQFLWTLTVNSILYYIAKECAVLFYSFSFLFSF